MSVRLRRVDDAGISQGPEQVGCALTHETVARDPVRVDRQILRRLSAAILRVDIRASGCQELDHGIHPVGRRGVQRGVARVVAGIEVGTKLERHRDRRKRQPFFLWWDPGAELGRRNRVIRREVAPILDKRASPTPAVAKTRGRHERCRPITARQQRVRAPVGQDTHHLHFEELRGQPERSRPNPSIHEREVVTPASDRRAFHQSCVRIRSMREEGAHQVHVGTGIVVLDVSVTQVSPKHRGVQRGVAKWGRVRVRAFVEQKRGQ